MRKDIEDMHVKKGCPFYSDFQTSSKLQGGESSNSQKQKESSYEISSRKFELAKKMQGI